MNGISGPVEVRVLTQVAATEAFEHSLADFLDACPYVHGGYTFSIHPLRNEDDS